LAVRPREDRLAASTEGGTPYFAIQRATLKLGTTCQFCAGASQEPQGAIQFRLDDHNVREGCMSTFELSDRTQKQLLLYSGIITALGAVIAAAGGIIGNFTDFFAKIEALNKLPFGCFGPHQQRFSYYAFGY
jgi:hypothetical protein